MEMWAVEAGYVEETRKMQGGCETQSSLGEQRCGVDESNKGEVQGRC